MVFDFLRRGAAVETVEHKASATGPVVAYQTSGRVAWSPRDSVSLTRTGFCGNPVGFRSVKLIAEAAAALPLVVQDAARRYDEHPLMELMRRPNAGQAGLNCWKRFMARCCSVGTAMLRPWAARVVFRLSCMCCARIG